MIEVNIRLKSGNEETYFVDKGVEELNSFLENSSQKKFLTLKDAKFGITSMLSADSIESLNFRETLNENSWQWHDLRETKPQVGQQILIMKNRSGEYSVLTFTEMPDHPEDYFTWMPIPFSAVPNIQ